MDCLLHVLGKKWNEIVSWCRNQLDVRKERDCPLLQDEKKELSPLPVRKERDSCSFSWKRKGLCPVAGRKEKDCLL
jgi:hypothetical protein